LVRVPVYNSTVPAVDITAAENRLFEWSGPAAEVLHVQGHSARPESGAAPRGEPDIAEPRPDRDGAKLVASAPWMSSSSNG